MWNLSHSESELLYNWRFTASQSVLATSPLRLTTNNFIFHLNTCTYSPDVTSSLARGWVCLQLLLVFASAVILRFKSRGTHDHILLSQIRGSPNLEGQVPIFISPRNRWPGYTPRHWVPFLSPPMIRRATVLTAAVMKSSVFWDITPCSLLKVKLYFGGTCLHLQG
jgi:hypothetical protein